MPNMSAADVDPQSKAALQEPPSRDRLTHDDQPTRTPGRNVGGDDQSRKNHRSARKSEKVCRYFGTKKGCRAGDSCAYLHVHDQQAQLVNLSTSSEITKSESVSEPAEPLIDVPTANKTKSANPQRLPVSKPVSSLQKTNPREFQIGQVVRRFSPERQDGDDGTTVLHLKLQPSDPDFPFELAALDCSVTVPNTWPSNESRPCLKVLNPEIPRGYQINIERGFDSIVTTQKTLLALLNDLDKKLELFLSTEKAQTIKIVANRTKQESSTVVKADQSSASNVSTVQPMPLPKADPKPSWTLQQKIEAKAKRDADVRQLEARMGRLPMFSSTQNGTVFNVPLQIPKIGRLPLVLQPLKEMTLKVPTLYDLEPCTIRLKGVYGIEVDNVEHNFEKHTIANRTMTLMAHINHLTQHLHEMVAAPIAPAQTKSEPEPEPEPTPRPSAKPEPEIQPSARTSANTFESGVVDEERPHLVFLARPPPEWSQQQDDQDDETDSDEYSSYEEYTDSESEKNEGGAEVPPSNTTTSLEKGILVSFPHLEMTGIELLELKSLSLSVKCDRCKDSLEIKSVKPASTDSGTIIRTESCKKCASPLSASYRAEPMHANSVKAGYLDLEGCTVQDMLPSNFVPTCSECSTTAPLPGITTVRGDTALYVCRECHYKMTVKIAEVKFLRVALNDSRIHRALPPKRKKEDLGITAGTELPERGRCKHYAKSFRWFRFSCCNRVFPCDRCHDAAEEHPNEHANRMICGLCSREQNYRPEDCGFCGRSVIRKTGGGFWEGGKGTRDRVKMNRNDPRKYKRVGGSTVGSKKK